MSVHARGLKARAVVTIVLRELERKRQTERQRERRQRARQRERQRERERERDRERETERETERQRERDREPAPGGAVYDAGPGQRRLVPDHLLHVLLDPHQPLGGRKAPSGAVFIYHWTDGSGDRCTHGDRELFSVCRAGFEERAPVCHQSSTFL
jgi:hypothetical protein